MLEYEEAPNKVLVAGSENISENTSPTRVMVYVRRHSWLGTLLRSVMLRLRS